MIPGVAESWDRIKAERESMLTRFRKEFDLEPKSTAKLDRVLDNMVGPEKRKRGRPKGSKNKPQLVMPDQIGHIPDLVFGR